MNLIEEIKRVLVDVVVFVEAASGLCLRGYQVDVARAVAESVIEGWGLSFVVMFPRQSGKNELQAQIETYLLTLFSQADCEMVKISPTWKPQSLNAMRRLERVLEKNVLVRSLWKKESGYIFRIGRARMFFLSGAPEANIVGATAGTLLEVDEAQDVLISKFDKDIAPMAASTNATRVFWGTAWTGDTLLARELRAARNAEREDGRRRVFVINAEDVAREVPAYGVFVAEQVAKLGRNHPMVRTQFFSEEINGEGGLFPEARRGMMRGDHKRLVRPEVGKVYAVLIDVAGEEEVEHTNTGSMAEGQRDATALTVVEVNLETMADALIQAPTYLVRWRKLWVGVSHTRLYGEIMAICKLWDAKRLVVDATGVGAGLASFLERSLPGRVMQFRFNGATKSQLGWDFLAVVDSGRFKDYGEEDGDQRLFWEQCGACQYEIVPGVERRMRWGVPEGLRNECGEFVHDDLVISAALCAVLDEEQWSVGGAAKVVERIDPIREMDGEGF